MISRSINNHSHARSATASVNGCIGNKQCVCILRNSERSWVMTAVAPEKNEHVHYFWNVCGHDRGHSPTNWEIHTLLIREAFTRACAVTVATAVMTAVMTRDSEFESGFRYPILSLHINHYRNVHILFIENQSFAFQHSCWRICRDWKSLIWTKIPFDEKADFDLLCIAGLHCYRWQISTHYNLGY